MKTSKISRRQRLQKLAPKKSSTKSTSLNIYPSSYSASELRPVTPHNATQLRITNNRLYVNKTGLPKHAGARTSKFTHRHTPTTMKSRTTIPSFPAPPLPFPPLTSSILKISNSVNRMEGIYWVVRYDTLSLPEFQSSGIKLGSAFTWCTAPRHQEPDADAALIPAMGPLDMSSWKGRECDD